MGRPHEERESFLPHYHLVLAGLGLDAIDPAAPQTLVDTGFLGFLVGELARRLPFDPEFYGGRYPDVAAMAGGRHERLLQHFVEFGFAEGRLPSRPAFDPGCYLEANPDLAGLHAQAGVAGLIEHYDRAGRHEGRAAHPGAMAAAGRWRDRVRATPYRLAHRTIKGAEVRAFAHPLIGAPGIGFRGGLVLTDAPGDLRLRHRRGGATVDSFPAASAAPRRLAGEYVYAGFYTEHFGHAMAETIHRILPARAVFGCRRLLYVGTGVHHEVAGFAALPPAMQAALRFLGVAEADVTVVHDNRIVDRLHVAEQGSDLTGGPRAPYLRMLADYTPARLEALDPSRAGPAGGRLYVSRSRIGHGNTVLGERYLERLLAAEGWTVLHPQELPLVGQMQAYRAAAVVMFAEGSACHGVELFGPEMLERCVLLERRPTHRALFARLLEPRATKFEALAHTVEVGSVVADETTGEALQHFGVSVFDLPALARSLRERGLARLAGLDPPAYRAAAAADFAAYLAHHRAAGTHGVDADARAALDSRCAALLGGVHA